MTILLTAVVVALIAGALWGIAQWSVQPKELHGRRRDPLVFSDAHRTERNRILAELHTKDRTQRQG